MESSAINFNLTDLFQQVHKIDLGRIEVPNRARSALGDQIFGRAFPDIPEVEEGEEREESYIGTPIWFPITFEGATYLRYQNAEIVEKELNDFRLPLSAVAEFQRTKDITWTPVAGEVGAIPEMFGFGEWSVTISGFIIPDPNQPQDLNSIDQQWDQLKEFEELADAINVRGEVFSRHDIEKIVIATITDKQVIGRPGIIPFTLQCYSTSDVDLILE